MPVNYSKKAPKPVPSNPLQSLQKEENGSVEDMVGSLSLALEQATYSHIQSNMELKNVTQEKNRLESKLRKLISELSLPETYLDGLDSDSGSAMEED